MWDELCNREVTARKAHECAWCPERIEKRQRCQYRSIVGEDGLQSSWMHLECWKAMQQADPSDLRDGWTPGDWKRGSTEPA